MQEICNTKTYVSGEYDLRIKLGQTRSAAVYVAQRLRNNSKFLFGGIPGIFAILFALLRSVISAYNEPA